MTSKAAFCHILVIWGLAQVTAQMNRGNIPAGVRSSMIANGWRPLTSYEHKSAAGHLPSGNLGGGGGGGGGNERNSAGSGPHPVHGKLQEHMSKSEKLSSKQNKHAHDYNPPSILGSFSVFGNSLPKTRGNGGDSGKSPVASETREYSFLVPPPREPVRYELDPYRKLILRDNEAFLRQPAQQYIISHPVGAAPGDIRNVQYFSKGGAAAGSASTHTITTLKNRPVITEYNGGAPGQQSLRPQQQQHVPFESLKLSNTKLFLQPPSANGAPNFAHEPQQPIDNIYERFPSAHLPHPQKLTQESSGNFYSHINHPSPSSYKGQTIERDPSFVVHESHELSYATPAPLQQASQPGFAAFSNFRPSSSYENLHSPERYSTLRPVVSHTEKFIPSKPDNTRQKQENYHKYPQNNANPNLDNSIVSPEYSNGIVNTYYISEQQSLTPPPPAAWSVPSKAKLTSDINEVLPKPDRPAKFNLESNSNLQESQRPSHQNNLHPNYVFPRPETQQQKQQPQQHQYFPSNPSINEQPETIYETPESLSLKHFNEQQYRLQQQLLQRDRERLREQQLREQQLQRQQQQIELGRITAAREREKQSSLSTPPSRPIPESPRPTVQYYDTTLIYSQLGVQPENQENQEIQKLPEQQFIQQEYETNPSKYQQPDVEAPVTNEPENVSSYVEPEISTTYESTEVPTTVGHRTRPRKPTTAALPVKHEHDQQQQQHRRRKPTTPSYEEPTHRHQEEEYHFSTLAPNPIVQSPGTPFSFPVSSETPTTVYQGTSYPSVTTGVSYASTIVTTSTTTSPPRTSAASSSTTSRPRSRRPSAGNGRRRRPTSTTTEQPETAPPVTYRHEDYTRYEKIESDSPRRRKPSSSVAPTTQPPHEIDPTTSTEQKRFEIQNYGHKLGANDHQDYVTELPETYNTNNEHVSSQQSYAYGNERDSAFYYTPAYEEGGQVTTGQESTDYGSSESASGHSTPTNSLNRGKTRENSENAGEIAKNVYANIPLEELFVNTESPVFYTTTTTTTAAPTTTTMTTPTSTRRATSAQPTKSSYARTTGTPVAAQTSTETVHTTRAPVHRMRPMRFGNSTRPRFSIKDYKTRMDYRNRKMSTSEAPSVYTRQKGSGAAKNQQENSEKESLESTTARYRHMSRVSYRMTSTTPSYQRHRDRDSANSTTERINRFTPKRRLPNNHLYRSKISTSTTTSQPSAGEEADSSDDVSITGTSSTSASTRPNSVRNENVFSSAIRRRPQMNKHAVFTQSSDLRTTRKQSTEMVPEETSFYSPAIAQQLLVTDYSASTSLKNNEESDNYPNVVTSEAHENNQLPLTTSLPQLSSPPSNLSSLPDENLADSEPMKLDHTSIFEPTTQSSTSPLNEAGQTEALVNESDVTLDAQFEQDLFAKASQSVADLTSSASALYDKPGMFKAVSVSPSASETGSSGSLINGRFKINQDKQPTLPIEAFFHQLASGKN